MPVEQLTQTTLKRYRKEQLERQGGICRLCGLPIDPDGRTPHVDHAHYKPNSGHVRGVLHAHCNMALGKIENVQKRYGVSDEVLSRIFEEYFRYTGGDYSGEPLYPKKKRKTKTKEERDARA